MVASVRRWGLPGLAAAVGAFLLLCGIAGAVVDAQQRSDAAAAAVALTPEQRERLDAAGLADDAAADARYFRNALIVQNLRSGGIMPERAVDVVDIGDGNVSMSWGPQEERGYVDSWGGWQLKPVGLLPFAGLALIIGSLFVAAARWRLRHPLG